MTPNPREGYVPCHASSSRLSERELLIKQLMKQVSKACLVLKVGVRVVWKHLSKGEEVREKGKVG